MDRDYRTSLDSHTKNQEKVSVIKAIDNSPKKIKMMTLEHSLEISLKIIR